MIELSVPQNPSEMGKRSVEVRKAKMGNEAFTEHMRTIAKKKRKKRLSTPLV